MKPAQRKNNRSSAAICFLASLLLLLLSGIALAAEPVEITVSGLQGELRDNVIAALALPPGIVGDDGINLPWLERFRDSIPERVSEALQPFGYYTAVTRVELQQRNDQEYRLRVRVTPGSTVRIAEVTMELTGQGAKERSLQRIADSLRRSKGNVLQHDVYEQVKGRLEARARELGYLDAFFPIHEIRVSPSDATAHIALELDTGRRYRFGETTFSGAPQYPQRFLERYLDYEVGDFFSEQKLTQSQINLAAADRFQGIILNPDRDNVHDDTMPVLAELTTLARRRLRPGIGYGTDTGVRGSVRYKDTNLFLLGHELRADINISPRLQGLAFAYLAPSYRDIKSSLGLQLNLQREDTSSYTTSKISLEGTWNRSLERGQLLTLYVKPQWESSSIGDQKTSTVLILPGVRFNHSSFDNPVRPRRGFRYGLEARGTHQVLGSATGLLQVIAEGYTKLPLPWRLSLSCRAKAGVTLQNEPLDELPASLRFFAGGDRSVRGYAYESLGPRDSNGDVVGGKNLLTAGIELERALFRSWGIAAFFDAGNAFDSLSRFSLYRAVGLGLRYYTPIGAIQLDVARQLGVDDPSFRVHVAVGIEL
jgi:translocation and assembly module TamA